MSQSHRPDLVNSDDGSHFFPGPGGSSLAESQSHRPDLVNSDRTQAEWYHNGLSVAIPPS